MRIGVAGEMFYSSGKSPIVGLGKNAGMPIIKSSEEKKPQFNPIKDLINQVNDAQVKSNQSIENFSIGQAESIHKVIVDVEEALLTMKFATQVRNKAIEAYQEIMRMQI